MQARGGAFLTPKDSATLKILRAGRYKVTPRGVIIDLDWRGTGRVKPVAVRLSRNGYLLANLATGGVPRLMTVTVHRVVALYFLGPPPDDGDQVNHKNGKKTDNRRANIEWASSFANMAHASRAGLLNIQRGSANINAKLNEATARRIKQRLARGETPTTIINSMGLKGKVSRAAVRQIAAGKAWRRA